MRSIEATVWVPMTRSRSPGPSEPKSLIVASPPCEISLSLTCRALGAHTPNSHPSGAKEAPSIPELTLLNVCSFTYLETDSHILRMLANPKLILASASPRRQELLREAGMNFEVHPAHIPETRNPGERALDYAQRLAREKAWKVAEQFPADFVLGADTIVVVDEEVLEKPVNEDDAVRMLRALSGRVHQVITGVGLIGPDAYSDTRACATQVYFRTLEEQEIQEYIAG